MLCSISGTLPEEDVDVPSAETSTLSLLAAVRQPEAQCDHARQRKIDEAVGAQGQGHEMPEGRGDSGGGRMLQLPQVPGQAHLAKNETHVAQSEEDPVKFIIHRERGPAKGKAQTYPDDADAEDMPDDGIFAAVADAAVQHDGQQRGDREHQQTAQGGRLPFVRRGGDFHGKADGDDLGNDRQHVERAGPCLGAQIGFRAVQVILLPAFRQLRGNALRVLLHVVQQGLGGRHG